MLKRKKNVAIHESYLRTAPGVNSFLEKKREEESRRVKVTTLVLVIVNNS